MLSKRSLEYIKHNVLILPFEDVLSKVMVLDERNGTERESVKNVVSQRVIRLVKEGQLEFCFYNPKSGKYDLLPDYMCAQIRMAKLHEGKFPSKLYRSLRKKAAYEVTSKIVDVHTKAMTETPAEHQKEVQDTYAWYEKNSFLVPFFCIVSLVITFVVLKVTGAL